MLRGQATTFDVKIIWTLQMRGMIIIRVSATKLKNNLLDYLDKVSEGEKNDIVSNLHNFLLNNFISFSQLP